MHFLLKQINKNVMTEKKQFVHFLVHLIVHHNITAKHKTFKFLKVIFIELSVLIVFPKIRVTFSRHFLNCDNYVVGSLSISLINILGT